MIYQGRLYTCRQGGHVSERVVAGGRAVQQVMPPLFVLWLTPAPHPSHIPHTHPLTHACQSIPPPAFWAGLANREAFLI